jgi:S-adenosylmethionine:tRNA ribosyltransferase-isomerase
MIENYSYTLPDERIARFPTDKPGDSRLLVYNGGKISHSGFARLPGLVEKNGLMVFNNTRVIQARIIMEKPTGAAIEVFLLEPVSPPQYDLAFAAAPGCVWKCMTGNRKKWKGGRLEKVVRCGDATASLFAEIENDHGEWQEIRFSWEPGTLVFGKIVDCAGLTPVPPYLNRAPVPADRQRYQTVYARHEGSVAAPTAGLHFTREILQELKARGTQTAEITLHVGAGTFRPVKVSDPEQHRMHAERFMVNASTLESVLESHGKITAVGTTSVRTLESLYWLGVKRLHYGREDPNPDMLSQWENRELPGDIPVARALEVLLNDLHEKGNSHLEAGTCLMIVPGYRFRLVNRLITNFHQPRSTLLMLIAAFIGEDWKKVYDYALENEFRFLSYGDSSLLIPRDGTQN